MPAGQPDRSLGPELRAPTRYTDGSTDETSEALDAIADLLAAPADPRQRVTVCRECEALFIPGRAQRYEVGDGLRAVPARDGVPVMAEVEVIVSVHVNGAAADPKALAVEMVKDALASRASRWQIATFVSEGDVRAK